MILWLWKAPYGPRFRKEAIRFSPSGRFKDLADIVDTLRMVACQSHTRRR